VIAVLLVVLLALLLAVVLVGWRGRRWRRWWPADDLPTDLLHGRREVLSVPLWNELAIDRPCQLASQPVRLGERPAVVSAVEQARDFVAATGELARDGSLDRRRGARASLSRIAAARGEDERATRRETGALPVNRATPFPRSPPASARQGRRPAETGPAWPRGRAPGTSCRDCRLAADPPSRG
jgi:hypothetical protein